MRSMISSSWSPRRFTWVHLLIALNVGVFLLQWGLSAWYPGAVESLFALSANGLKAGRYWQFVTYMFLHGGVLHLLVNCIGLLFAGREVERMLGARQFLWLYFLGGILGGVLQILFSGGPMVLVGASAGVCAVLLAFTSMLPEVEITALFYFIIPVRMRAKWLGYGVIAVSVFFIATGLGRGVGHLAHLGGALFGWFYVWRLGYAGSSFEESWIGRRITDARKERERQEEMDPSEFISQEIDPILDKISREGIHSLSRAERRILEKGREKIEKKTRGR